MLSLILANKDETFIERTSINVNQGFHGQLFTAILYTNSRIVLRLVVSSRAFQQNVQTDSSAATWKEHHFFRGASMGQKPLLQVESFIMDETLMLTY